MALSGAPMASRTLLRSSVYRDVAMGASTSPPSPRKVRKFTNRKNYLREKLLKTLKKPYSSSLSFELPRDSPVVFPNESLPEENRIFSLEHCAAEGGEKLEELEIQEVRVAEVTKGVEVMENSVSEVSKGYFFKFGLWLLGAFVFQTICAVWVLGSADIIDNSGNSPNEKDQSGISDVGMNGKVKSRVKLIVNGNKGFETDEIIYWDDEDMDKKIEEIQVMAREARKMERLERENNDFESNDNEEEDEEAYFGKSGIEKEVGDQLIKLRRRLGNFQEKLSVSFTDNMKKGGGKKDEAEKDDLAEKDGNVDLIFKKKYKFRGSLSGHSDKPKGFKHSDHLDAPIEVMKGDIDGGGTETDGAGKQSVEASKSLGIAGNKLVQREKRKAGKRVDLVSESNGLTQDRIKGSSETVKSSKSNVLETPAISSKHNLLNQKGDSKGRRTEDELSAKIGPRKSESEVDLWWLRLPYVLVIFMRRGLADEGLGGPFTLKDSSCSNSKLSHTVAFEDRGDATNFCHILQSFFEDLGDFSAEIVPLSIKELKAAVDSEIIRVIVVKKGQLKLYAGQPLPDVEIALRSILGRTWNTC